MSYSIEAEIRNDCRSRANERLRRANRIPACVYGANRESTSISVDAFALDRLLKDQDVYTSILNLQIDKKKESVIIKAIQKHTTKNALIHIDFQRVSTKQRIVTRVPLDFIGAEENPSLRIGAILNPFMNAIEISCLPSNLPHQITVNIAELEVGESLNLEDLELPKGVEIVALQQASKTHTQSVVSIISPKKGGTQEAEELDAEAGSSEDKDEEE